MAKAKFSVKDLLAEAWSATKTELHDLGFAIFENAKTNEVVLLRDAELAGIAAVEGNMPVVEADALNAARVLLEKHAPEPYIKPDNEEEPKEEVKEELKEEKHDL